MAFGEVDDRISDRSRFLHGLLKDFDDRAALSGNIFGYLLSKLGYGSLLYATALTNEPIADVFAAERHRAVLIALVRQILSVTRAEGVTPESKPIILTLSRHRFGMHTNREIGLNFYIYNPPATFFALYRIQKISL